MLLPSHNSVSDYYATRNMYLQPMILSGLLRGCVMRVEFHSFGEGRIPRNPIMGSLDALLYAITRLYNGKIYA